MTAEPFLVLLFMIAMFILGWQKGRLTERKRCTQIIDVAVESTQIGEFIKARFAINSGASRSEVVAMFRGKQSNADD